MPAYSSSPPSALQALADAELPSDRLSVADSISLVQALRAVPDPRQRRGRRHGLQSVLLLALGAVLAGAHSFAAIADWAAQADHAVTVCRPTPHATTFGRVLAAVDVGALERALTGWVLARRARLADQRRGTGEPVAAGRQVLAVDGKTLRGARDQTGTQAKLMAVYDHRERLVLAQTDVGGGDALAAFPATLATLPDLQDVLITADALHCQREHAAWLHARGGHYLFTVKGNQPALRQTLVRLPWACAPGQLERHHAHGRAESRSVKVIDLESGPTHRLFPHAARAIKVVRRRRRRGHRPSIETVYAITSLTHRQADPGLLAAWIRSHWCIENRLHWIRDVTLGEDHSSIRTGAGPQVMAALRNTAINLARLAGHTNIAAAQRHFAHQPATVHRLLTAA